MYRFAYNNYTIKTNTNGLIWHNELSADRIQKALNKWQMDIFPGDMYRFLNVNNSDLQMILKSFSIKIMNKLYRRGEIKALKTAIKF